MGFYQVFSQIENDSPCMGGTLTKVNNISTLTKESRKKAAAVMAGCDTVRLHSSLLRAVFLRTARWSQTVIRVQLSWMGMSRHSGMVWLRFRSIVRASIEFSGTITDFFRLSLSPEIC